MPVYFRVIEAYQITQVLRSDRRTWPAWLSKLLDVELRDDIGSLFATNTEESDGKLTLRDSDGSRHLMNWDDWVVYDVGSVKFYSAEDFANFYRQV